MLLFRRSYKQILLKFLVNVDNGPKRSVLNRDIPDSGETFIFDHPKNQSPLASIFFIKQATLYNGCKSDVRKLASWYEAVLFECGRTPADHMTNPGPCFKHHRASI